MTRISTMASNSILLDTIFRTQQRVLDSQIQVATEKRSQDYQGIAGNSRRLVNIENSSAALERFISNNEQQDVRFQITENVMESVKDTVLQFRNQLSNYASGEKRDRERAEAIQVDAFEALKTIENLLNTEVDGRFLFSGSRVGTQPVSLNVNTISGFQTTFDGARVTYPTTRDAHLESFTINSDTNNLNNKFVDPSNLFQFRQHSTGSTTTTGSSSIEASSALFSNVAAGTTITIANTTSNNGTYTVDTVASDGRSVTVKTDMFTDEANLGAVTITYPDTDDPANPLTLTNANLGLTSFTRSTDTITATNANSLAALTVGTAFTVSGTTQNDGSYTVKTNDGTNLVIEAKKLTDEAADTTLGTSTFFDHFTDTDVVFTAGTNTIEVRQSGTATVVPNIFNGLAVGNTFDVTNSASNNATFTITSIAADGSSVTVAEALTGETDSTGANFAGAASVPFSYISGSQMVITNVGAAGTDTIQIQDSGGAALTNVFDTLAVGEAITLSGTAGHDANYTISAISADGSTITVAEDITVATATDTDGARLRVFGASGTISATSYFSGDQTTLTHRVDSDRSISLDLTGAHPGIEKAIRGLSIILQGAIGTEGGLDQNTDRSGQAMYLMDAALERTVAGTPPFGTETAGSIEQAQIDLGFSRVLINTTNLLHRDFIGFFENSITDIENVSSTEAITELLDNQRSLEASFQVFARIRELSLTNFI
ncbi:MAG: hypothetical protein HOL41_10970 [Rhodospirillaceae bacterium]|nr:hypothetical protein [Rhodospirillaceae bacterium]